MKRQLEQLIDTKLLYAEARRTVPAENFTKIEQTLAKQFEEDRIPQLHETTKTSNRAELEAKLRTMGTSLAQRRQAFIENVLAQQWLRQKAATEAEITHEELWNYYQQHPDEFDYQAKVRWEEILVRFDRCATRAAARQAIVQMGNLVWYGRVPFDQVAREYSHGVTAEEGGRHDWTTQGSLRSTVVNDALFSLPIGALSQILEDDTGLRIVRVIERSAAGRTPFSAAQPEIRRRLVAQRKDEQFKAYLAQLRKTTPMWTLFDGDATHVSARHDAQLAQ